MLKIHKSLNSNIKKNRFTNIKIYYQCICEILLCHENLNYLQGYLDAQFDTIT